MTIAIVVAMLEEIQPIRDHLQVQALDKIGHVKIERATYRNEEIYLVESGIGKANAAMGASIVLDRYAPDLVLNYGVVGSLNPDLGLGDLFIGTDFVYHDADETAFGSPYGKIPRMPETYPLSEDLRDFIDELLDISLDFDLQSGQILTSDSFVADEGRLDWIKKHFPKGQVVDMEATAIAQVAYTFATPFLSIKIVSDDAGDMAEDLYEETKDRATKAGFKFVIRAIDLYLDSF